MRLFRGMPSSSFFLLENRIEMYLLLNLAAAGVAGQRIVDNLSLTLRFIKLGKIALSLLKKQALLYAKVPQASKKCASSSIALSEQYLQILLDIGVETGRVYLPVSICKLWALILSLVNEHLWFRFFIIST